MLALRTWTVRRFLVVVLGVAGIGVLLYPSAAAWFSDRAHAATVSGYVQAVRSMPPAETRRLLAQAHDYNRHLPAGPLLDPYSASGGGRETAIGSAAAAYLHTLDVGPEGMIGVLAIRSINLDLPIYHGTGSETLDHGVGHLFGTALPVGGPGTHAVLTGHSGIVNATLFSNLHHVQLGDEFTVTVLDQTLTYRVDQIRTVLPTQTRELVAVPGKDYVTLVTCTPIGVNTHRLLVRGVRVQTPGPGTPKPDFLTGHGGPGFPWWLAEALGAVVLVLVLTRPRTDLRPPRQAPCSPEPGA